MDKKKTTIILFNALSQLLESNLTLIMALEFISKSSTFPQKVKSTAENIGNRLKEGYALFPALKINCDKNIMAKYEALFLEDFDSAFLCKILKFICFEEKRIENLHTKILTELLYPSFLFLLSICLSCFLYLNKNSFLFFTSGFNVNGLIASFSYLVIFLAAFIFLVLYVQRDSFEYVFFTTGFFLLQNNMEITQIIKINLVDKKNRLAVKKLKNVLTSLYHGNSFFYSAKKSLCFSTNITALLELSEGMESLQKSFGIICDYLKNKKNKKYMFFSKISEPLLISGFGIYLLMLVEKTVLPFFTMSGLLNI